MHIYNYVNTVLLPQNYEIYLLTLSADRVKESYRAHYAEQGVTLYSIAEAYGASRPNRTRKERLQNLFLKLRLMRQVPEMDICHIHSAYRTSLIFYRLFRKKFCRLILSYWGGDIENRSPKLIKLRERCFPHAQVITVTTEKMREDFVDLYGHRYDDKLRVCRFATRGLQCIHDMAAKKTKADCKAAMHIAPEKICLTCGYSAYAAQHQEVILNKIALLPKALKERLHLLVPMQYGRYDQPYIDRVHEAAKHCGCVCDILEEYVPFEDAAIMSLATDFYFHMRDTDAFSNALKEQVYAGSVVIQGSWLQYYELDEMKAPVLKVDSFDELPDLLLKQLSDYTPTETHLFEPIYNLYSPEPIYQQWNEVICAALTPSSASGQTV